ncbi:MAG TPA: hypothetical protein PKD09_10655 [Aggregatilinea sp.]|nr:hypothetical protein [Aggregatilinea sp.]HML22103.1 hypothetical protein [Aggregatilinea sp.]
MDAPGKNESDSTHGALSPEWTLRGTATSPDYNPTGDQPVVM